MIALTLNRSIAERLIGRLHGLLAAMGDSDFVHFESGLQYEETGVLGSYFLLRSQSLDIDIIIMADLIQVIRDGYTATYYDAKSSWLIVETIRKKKEEQEAL